MRRRRSATLLCVLALLVAGCQAPGSASNGDGFSGQPTAGTETTTPETFVLEVENETAAEPAANQTNGDPRPDPETDRLGWEAGYWANESLQIRADDGLNETERDAVVARAMARVETIRDLEFERTVPVTLVSRAELRNRSGPTYGEALRRFDDGKFEALFLVGEDRSSIAVQDQQLGSTVLGYYSSRERAIVLITESETPHISENTLAHELVHALQDQHFGLGSDARTRDAVQGDNGLVEGDATAVDQRYSERCREQWDCLEPPTASGGGGDGHFGLNFLQYFPYSDGPGLVAALRDRGGWTAVNDAYDARPESAVEVIDPSQYPDWERETVELPDRSSGEWERVRPSADRQRPDYGVVGPSAIAAALAYTLTDDYNESAVVRGNEVVNFVNGEVDQEDPYNYDLPATRGWRGGKLYVYANGNESGYVWKTTWDSERDAREFADAWAQVVGHWGGTETADGTWVIAESSPFADAVSIRVDGKTVTVVNAPTEGDLEEVHDA